MGYEDLTCNIKNGVIIESIEEMYLKIISIFNVIGKL